MLHVLFCQVLYNNYLNLNFGEINSINFSNQQFLGKIVSDDWASWFLAAVRPFGRPVARHRNDVAQAWRAGRCQLPCSSSSWWRDQQPTDGAMHLSSSSHDDAAIYNHCNGRTFALPPYVCPRTSASPEHLLPCTYRTFAPRTSAPRTSAPRTCTPAPYIGLPPVVCPPDI